ncbi:TadE family type IV pilus minor pilin [Arthrobacter sp. RIT-PI-e]|uniref:TadE family type IV pilus minor pilin n=1 Tax=Arthrobacter sp. RIT-PI-e TaxID=1681197 RepID=UPI000A7142F1|nr:TadE family type IV pilus minor pilin [Arthrobacter sp. RIT-PI-e]
MVCDQGGERPTAGTGRGSVRPSRGRHRPGTAGAVDAGHRAADHGERGAVTAEIAVVLPALVVLLALLLGTAHVGTVQLRIEEAARAGAREAMRGESMAAVEQTVQRLAGSGARTRVGAAAGWITVEVRTEGETPLVGLLGITLEATASGKDEHGG